MSIDCVVINANIRDTIVSSICYLLVVISECVQSVLFYQFELYVLILSTILTLHVDHQNLLLLIGCDFVHFNPSLLTFPLHLYSTFSGNHSSAFMSFYGSGIVFKISLSAKEKRLDVER